MTYSASKVSVSDDSVTNGSRVIVYTRDWNEDEYSYVGLKVEDGRIVPCPKSEAMDFYFAVMQDLNVDDTLTEVRTVEHTQYGITMKIIDFPDRMTMSNYLGSNAGGAVLTCQQGILSSDLKENGYPDTTGGSLANLFSGVHDVNRLFIQSTYSETGYFEYDSAQNFASLKGAQSGDFTVYKELGTYDSDGGRPTLKHGQFRPFNDLKPGTFASVNGKNLYSTRYGLLPDSDARKYEQLYTVGYDNQKVDCCFGVELEASFTQTPSGLDAWGHDIIFNFTGDDFWLYVDGELVLDLGGIHSAVPGSVNFRTGEVNENGTIMTLRQVFERNYRARNTSASDADMAAYLAQYFEEGSTVFKDDTNHTMRIFCMERGAGASNLCMRFNLAAVRKGSAQLSKTLTGAEGTDVLAEYPYQIYYKYKDAAEGEEGEEAEELEARLTNGKRNEYGKIENYVFYKDTVTPVKYRDTLTIDGIVYENVFFLKPGQTADISFPEGTTSYRIVECGVTPRCTGASRSTGPS